MPNPRLLNQLRTALADATRTSPIVGNEGAVINIDQYVLPNLRIGAPDTDDAIRTELNRVTTILRGRLREDASELSELDAVLSRLLASLRDQERDRKARRRRNFRKRSSIRRVRSSRGSRGIKRLSQEFDLRSATIGARTARTGKVAKVAKVAKVSKLAKVAKVAKTARSRAGGFALISIAVEATATRALLKTLETLRRSLKSQTKVLNSLSRLRTITRNVTADVVRARRLNDRLTRDLTEVPTIEEFRDLRTNFRAQVTLHNRMLKRARTLVQLASSASLPQSVQKTIVTLVARVLESIERLNANATRLEEVYRGHLIRIEREYGDQSTNVRINRELVEAATSEGVSSMSSTISATYRDSNRTHGTSIGLVGTILERLNISILVDGLDIRLEPSLFRSAFRTRYRTLWAPRRELFIRRVVNYMSLLDRAFTDLEALTGIQNENLSQQNADLRERYRGTWNFRSSYQEGDIVFVGTPNPTWTVASKVAYSGFYVLNSLSVSPESATLPWRSSGVWSKLNLNIDSRGIVGTEIPSKNTSGNRTPINPESANAYVLDSTNTPQRRVNNNIQTTEEGQLSTELDYVKSSKFSFTGGLQNHNEVDPLRATYVSAYTRYINTLRLATQLGDQFGV